jgi:aquaglyceroporin related protein
MVAPFLGCLFGGFLYDTFVFTGKTPINSPVLGLKRFFNPRREVWSNTFSKDTEKV